MENDSHDICTNCRGQVCNGDNHYAHRYTWNTEKWGRVQLFLDKLALLCERKKENRCRSSSSSCFQVDTKFQSQFLSVHQEHL